jgi:uncharacterized protein
MKKITLMLLTLLLITSLKGQDITGSWYGVLDIRGTPLRLVFNISKTDIGFSATMDSPDQGAKGIPMTAASFENAILKLSLTSAKIEYEGKLEQNNAITGIFKQGGQSLPLNLSREKSEKKALVRPQEPTKPYPYYTEDVTFENPKAKITLAGTLTLPQKEGNFPVVVLISGSGLQNRNCEVFGHKLFLVLADYLTKKGIGVLRYDDRGFGESKGDPSTATTQDFATDVEAAVNYLKMRKEVNKTKIGLIGHSEGGIIAPMVAARSKDINFIVLLAGPGITGADISLFQQKVALKALGASDKTISDINVFYTGVYDIIAKTDDTEKLRNDLIRYCQEKIKDNPTLLGSDMSSESKIKQVVNELMSAWILHYLRYNPVPILKDVKCPVLALNGDKDMQVPSKINLESIKKGLEKGKNKHVTIKEMPNLNHLFQECTTGSSNEYGKIEQTFSPTALNELGVWILKQVK